MAAANSFADRASELSTTDDHEIENLLSLIGGARVGISNKSELRLRLEEFDDGGEVWQFLAYAEQDRGLLESECIESSALEYI